jgi:phospholipid transport system substrate-binding protein
MFRGLKFATLALCLGLFPALSAQAAATPAEDVVAQAYTVLVGIMKDAKSLGFAGRVEKITPLVETAFNLPLMAQTTAAAYWGKATEEQRARYVEAFKHMTAATLAVRFSGYSGEKFDVTGSEEKAPNTSLVKTHIVQSNGEPVEVDYLVRNSDAGWKVADVYADGGISELAVKTADYASVLKSGGVEALTSALEDKAAALADQERQHEASNTR